MDVPTVPSPPLRARHRAARILGGRWQPDVPILEYMQPVLEIEVVLPHEHARRVRRDDLLVHTAMHILHVRLPFAPQTERDRIARQDSLGQEHLMSTRSANNERERVWPSRQQGAHHQLWASAHTHTRTRTRTACAFAHGCAHLVERMA